MLFIERIIAAVAGVITGFISATGYLGVVLLMAIESACIPLPSEIIMPFAGYLVATGKLNLLAVATAGAIGCNLGSIPAYALGKWGGRAAIVRWGRFVLIDTHDLDMAERFFARFGGVAVLIARMLPLIRSFIAFPAGIARMPLLRFHVYTFVGSWPWCFGLAWIGKTLGARWNDDPRLSAAFHRFDVVIALVIVGAAVWFVRHRWVNRTRGAGSLSPGETVSESRPE